MRPAADNPTVPLSSATSGSQFPSRDHSSERFPCFQCRPKLTLALSNCSELNFRLSLLHSTCCFPLPPIKGSKKLQCFSQMWMYFIPNPEPLNPQPLRKEAEGLLYMLAQREPATFSLSSPQHLLPGSPFQLPDCSALAVYNTDKGFSRTVTLPPWRRNLANSCRIAHTQLCILCFLLTFSARSSDLHSP